PLHTFAWEKLAASRVAFARLLRSAQRRNCRFLAKLCNQSAHRRSVALKALGSRTYLSVKSRHRAGRNLSYAGGINRSGRRSGKLVGKPAARCGWPALSGGRKRRAKMPPKITDTARFLQGFGLGSSSGADFRQRGGRMALRVKEKTMGA